MFSRIFLSAVVFFLVSPLAFAQKKIQSDLAIQAIMNDLKMDSSATAELSTVQILSSDDRDYVTVSLYHPSSGDIRLLLNGPRGFLSSGSRHPVMFLSAGFFASKESVTLMDNPGERIVVGYEYPTTKEAVQKDLSLFPKAIRVAPAQMALGLKWLQMQSWTATDKISVMGVSLGSLFMPVSLRLAEALGVKTQSVILAYGGVNAVEVLGKMLDPQIPEEAKKLVIQFVEAVTSLHKPELHLPFLKGPFLAIYGTQDEIFPMTSSMKQFELLPESKELRWISGPHIDVDKPEIIQEAMMMVQDFLQRH